MIALQDTSVVDVPHELAEAVNACGGGINATEASNDADENKGKDEDSKPLGGKDDFPASKAVRGINYVTRGDPQLCNIGGRSRRSRQRAA